MTYHVKKEHLRNWDLQQIDGKPRINIVADDDDDDDQDIYISERSSLTSSNDTSQVFSPDVKRLPTPILSSRLSLSQKTPHTLRYLYNELPDNGIPIASQYQQQCKDVKKKEKNLRKAPPGQGKLVPIPQTKLLESGDNYYPYWYYYKVKNPDWIMRNRRTVDGRIIPYDSFDPSKYAPQPAITTIPIKLKKRVQKSRHNDAPKNQYNHEKQRLDYADQNSSASSPLIFYDDREDNPQQQHSLPKHYIPLKDADNNEHREQQTKRKILQQPQQHHKLKTKNEWSDHYTQSNLHKPPHHLNNIIITSNPVVNRSKNQSKLLEKHSLNSHVNGNGKNHHHHQPIHLNNPSSQQSHHRLNRTPTNNPSSHHHHHHHHSNQIHLQHPSSKLSEQNHHYNRYPIQTHQQKTLHSLSQQNHYPDYYQQHVHIRRHVPSSATADSNVQVVDVFASDSIKNDTHVPAQVFYNQTHHLPSIIHDYYHKTNTPRFPTEYHNIFARQVNGSHGQKTTGKTKLYKPDLHSQFSDHRLHRAVDKRLAV